MAIRYLFQRFPALAKNLPWMPLAKLPTPVQRLEQLGHELKSSNLWIKRDDLDSDIYSGNKVRKFEFIFADAKAKKKTCVLTMGSAGSNHGAATTLYCRELGFDVILALCPQPVLSYVRQNILVNHNLGANIMCSGNDVTNVLNIAKLYFSNLLQGKPQPYFMYFGGSSAIGNVGFVEAGLELGAQVQAGELPEPKYLFVATGSCGTHAGLLVGLRLAGLSTRVMGVRIVPKMVTNKPVVAFHANRLVRFLRSHDRNFPVMKFHATDIDLLEDYFGGQYGRPTASGKEAINLLGETEGIPLDPTYTGKAFAGLLGFVRQQNIIDEPTLFWQTLNTADLSKHIPQEVPEDLPMPLQKYFQKPLYDPDL